MFDEISEILKKQDVEYTQHEPLDRHTSIRIGGKAGLFVLPSDREKLITAIRAAREYLVPTVVVGNMTNTLPRDEEFQGIVIKTTKIDRYYVAEDVVSAECGCVFPRLASAMLRRDLCGVEELFMIPGSVGAMCVGNAGAYGKSMSDIFIRGDFYDAERDRVLTLENKDMNFEYRNSSAKRQGLVLLSADLQFRATPSSVAKSEVSRLARIRKDAQPTSMCSLGSIFKRRDGIGIGYYIDRAGLKGYRIGGAAVSEKHAGFIVNLGGATADDVLRLIAYIKEVVREKFGFTPEEEIEIL